MELFEQVNGLIFSDSLFERNPALIVQVTSSLTFFFLKAPFLAVLCEIIGQRFVAEILSRDCQIPNSASGHSNKKVILFKLFFGSFGRITMPRRFKRKFRKRRGSFRSKKGNLRKKIQRVERECRPDYKVFDDIYSDSAFNTAIIISNLPVYRYYGLPFGATGSATNTFGAALSVAGGTQSYTPKFHSFTIRGEVGLQSNYLLQGANVRLIWYWDSDAAFLDSGGLPVNNFPQTHTSILAVQTATTQTAPANGGIYTGYNPVTVGKGKRYRILSDKVYSLSNSGKNNFQVRLKLKVRKTVGMAQVPALAPVLSQNLGLCLVSDVPGGQTSWPYFTFSNRLCYSG